MQLATIPTLKAIMLAVGVALLLCALLGHAELYADAESLSEYESYVHNYSGSLANWTYIEKPVFPVSFNDSQIPVGQNWSIICPLMANHSYHVYCYGDWINETSEPKTDYDIYVYNPLDELEGYHTESAGLPEHLGTTVEKAFFVPKQDGNYTFVLVNDARESKSAQQATFMILEAVESNKWHKHYVEGKDLSDQPVLKTSWSYEFTTESQQIQVFIKVPETLDMYEARLYLMSDSSLKNRTVLNSIPLAWEPGLLGNKSKGDKVIGGYNLESREFRGVAYASCEFFGEDMFINYTSPCDGKSLYHLVLIGEIGSGTTDFLVKTEFDTAYLEPLIEPERECPQNDTVIAYFSSLTDLENATLQYSIDGWQTENDIDMKIVDGRTCEASIPGQAAGTFVSYIVRACDKLENVMTANKTYPVKYTSTLNFSLNGKSVRIGDNITVKGFFSPPVGDVPITIYLVSTNDTKRAICYTLEDGMFSASFKPETLGKWIVYAEFNGTDSIFETSSPWLTIEVVETLFSKYSFYIFGGIGAVVAVSIVIYVKKSRS